MDKGNKKLLDKIEKLENELNETKHAHNSIAKIFGIIFIISAVILLIFGVITKNFSFVVQCIIDLILGIVCLSNQVIINEIKNKEVKESELTEFEIPITNDAEIEVTKDSIPLSPQLLKLLDEENKNLIKK